MQGEEDIKAYLNGITADPELNLASVCHRITEPQEARFGQTATPWPAPIEDLIKDLGLDGLYSHQAQAIDLARSGRNVVVATPTASGKSLIYNLPVLEACLSGGRAMYLFPLKALAQDQLGVFERLAAYLPEQGRPTAGVYDGDTAPARREELRRRPPNVILTNPEMLNLSFLAYHRTWGAFLRNLRYVVVDEVHTYRGVMGSHMAWVFRRFLRICRLYGANPTFIFCSATVANPAELAANLTGLEVAAVTASGAPVGRRHFLFFNPLDGPARAAIALLRMAAEKDLRTIVYTQSRKMTELIAIWAETRKGRLAGRISAYRSGFLPEERREIEARLASGELAAVVSTSALELGIDIGGLDVCILVGYPGTVMATLQRGGRVGRSMRESVTALVAGEDALDQYFMRHPDDFFSRPPESAVINPANPVIMARHLVCAAAELALGPDDPLLGGDRARDMAAGLAARGDLVRRGTDGAYVSAAQSPQRDIDLRGSGRSFNIHDSRNNRVIGRIDGMRACKETHPGAVYLHRGRTWLVSDLDFEENVVRAAPAEVDYFTRALSRKDTEILEIRDSREVLGTRLGLGTLRVTEAVLEYEKRRVRGKRLISIEPLDLPPQTYETEGFWIEIPEAVQIAAESRYLHFMGGIHAMEHGIIGLLPLLVMADRNDLGGISTPFHPQINGAAVFVYDGAPGGVGLCRAAFARAGEVLRRTLEAIVSCPCEGGCPSCVHSPKCGSGNRPIDKDAAIFILGEIVSGAGYASGGARKVWPVEVAAEQGRADGPGGDEPAPAEPAPDAAAPSVPAPDASRPKTVVSGPGESLAVASEPEAARPVSMTVRSGESEGDSEEAVAPDAQRAPVRELRYGVFDLETQRSAAEVGGWGQARRMGLSCAVLFDSLTGEFMEFLEADAPRLVQTLAEMDLVVGFNIRRFDYAVLSAYTDFNLLGLPTLDLLERIQRRLGYRLSLDNLARATLGAAKSADGLQALRWWKEGRIAEIMEYCRQDVSVTLDLYRFGRDNGYVLFTNKAGMRARIVADWGIPALGYLGRV